MTAPTLINTLPGRIPKLLRRGSSVWYNKRAYVVESVEECRLSGLWLAPEQFATCQLDLDNETSRWHAGLWCNQCREYVTFTEQFTVDIALRGQDMTPQQIDLLARIVLRLASEAA